MSDVITEAINNKKRLYVTYNGAQRLIEPHTYGYDSSGTLKLRAFQVSVDPELNGWRMFSVNKMTEIKVIEEIFASPQPGYKREDSNIVRIQAQL